VTDFHDAVLERRALAELVNERKQALAQDEATWLARPTCDGCGLDHGGAHVHRWGDLTVRVCEDCEVDAERFPLDELRDVLAWRLVHNSWSYGHVRIIPGLAERVGFRLYLEAEGASLDDGTVRPAPSSRRFDYASVPTVRALLTADHPTVRPPDDEDRCPAHGIALSRGDGYVPGTGGEGRPIYMPNRLWFCKACERGEPEPEPLRVTNPEAVRGNLFQRVRDHLTERVHGRA